MLVEVLSPDEPQPPIAAAARATENATAICPLRKFKVDRPSRYRRGVKGR
jgi:hypothetical protein